MLYLLPEVRLTLLDETRSISVRVVPPNLQSGIILNPAPDSLLDLQRLLSGEIAGFRTSRFIVEGAGTAFYRPVLRVVFYGLPSGFE